MKKKKKMKKRSHLRMKNYAPNRSVKSQNTGASLQKSIKKEDPRKVESLQNALKSVNYVFLLLNVLAMIPMFSELIEANVYLHIAYQFRGILKLCIKEIIIKWW